MSAFLPSSLGLRFDRPPVIIGIALISGESITVAIGRDPPLIAMAPATKSRLVVVTKIGVVSGEIAKISRLPSAVRAD
jgi:hypothetical protein